MKQVLQNLRDGRTELANVPAPKAGRRHLLIRTSKSLVSVGTERMLVEFGNAGLIGKARQQPDKVRMVLDKVKTDGLAPTIDAVRNKLDSPLPLGYCNIGTVVEIGADASGFAPGDRVASNGHHAEIVNVPVNLCAKVPDVVGDEEAAFTVVGAIALQGIRLMEPALGEKFVVTGLGLIGLITVQLLRASGAQVLGIDMDKARLDLARQFGAETVDLSGGQDPITAAENFSRGQGVDGVIITASTKSSKPVHQAAVMCRKLGRIVLVGVAGLELSRADFYEKELTFQVSCSYGPGRYDTNYEENGQDYPFGYVRWTEQRNFEAVLETIRQKRIDVTPLISHRFSIDDARDAYRVVGGSEPSLGILLHYNSPRDRPDETLLDRTTRLASKPSAGAGRVSVGFIGTGNYAAGVLVPAVKATGARLKSAASIAGVSGLHVSRKFGFEETTTDAEQLLNDPEINAVVISTRHDSHAGYVIAALKAGKHVFVEKPLCLTHADLAAVEQAFVDCSQGDSAPILMVGFNRRFAPQVQKIKTLLAGMEAPKSFILTVNAGAIPANHWTQDPTAGGGRIIGEACHFVDLLRHLAGSSITGAERSMMASATSDTASIQLSFANGSIGTVHYFANGSKSFPKERLEVFCAGRILQLDNFRTLRGFGWPGFKRTKLRRQDKGQTACAAAFISAVREAGVAPIPVDEILEVSRVSIDLAPA